LVADKATKQDANYRQARSQTRRCGQCEHFRAGERATCTVVEGEVGAWMVSDLFKPRSG
jgi:hypothetical protein